MLLKWQQISMLKPQLAAYCLHCRCLDSLFLIESPGKTQSASGLHVMILWLFDFIFYFIFFLIFNFQMWNLLSEWETLDSPPLPPPQHRHIFTHKSCPAAVITPSAVCPTLPPWIIPSALVRCPALIIHQLCLLLTPRCRRETSSPALISAVPKKKIMM